MKWLSIRTGLSLVAGSLLVFPWFQAAGADARPGAPQHTIVNLTALAPPGLTVVADYLNNRGEVAGTLENLTTIHIAAFVFDGHKLVSLKPPKGYRLTVSFGISSAGLRACSGIHRYHTPASGVSCGSRSTRIHVEQTAVPAR